MVTHAPNQGLEDAGHNLSQSISNFVVCFLFLLATYNIIHDMIQIRNLVFSFVYNLQNHNTAGKRAIEIKIL